MESFFRLDFAVFNVVLRREIAFFLVILAFALAISLTAVAMNPTNPYNLLIQLFALNGFIALATAAILTAFLKEVTLFFKKPFIRVHHYFAAAGLVLITLHPVLLAIQLLDPTVFVPNFSSLYLFLVFGGRQALIFIYIAIAAVFLRRKFVAYWRWFHALMYVALFFGVLHADLLGTDFQNTAILIVYNGLFVAALAAFGWKRWQFHQIKARSKKSLASVKKS